MPSLQKRVREIPPEHRMAAIAAAVLVLSMALPWYQRTVDPGAERDLVSKSLNAFGVFTFVEAAILLVAAGVLFLIWARMEGKGFHLPGGDGFVISLAGGWAVALLIWRVFDRPGRRRAGRRRGRPVGLPRGPRRRGRARRRRARACAPRTAPSRPTRPRTSTGRRPPRARAGARPTASRATRPPSPRSCATARTGTARSPTRRTRTAAAASPTPTRTPTSRPTASSERRAVDWSG